ncbi:TetR/AcrR family transcriptional regulator [Haladaptatus sp. DYSN1]|uniref:TetR/AcrR family transcriptional regulator n=1 Tax=unclassified Haladaptatus TaxID=2622732 RepID=UPI002405F85C|nr:TetR/AcrR family transcriptional regulator [Haladaptatus sp. DYSN1]
MTAETKEQILEATHQAICAHGYADLTMQRIADHSALTTAAIHYHFDTKEELLNAFLDHLLARFEDRLVCEARDPRERLMSFLDAIFISPAEGPTSVSIALMELKAQAPHHEAYRAKLLEMDERMRAILTDAIEDGIEAGYFADVDAASVARFVLTVINGAHARHVALDEPPIETDRDLRAYLAQRLDWTPEAVV